MGPWGSLVWFPHAEIWDVEQKEQLIEVQGSALPTTQFHKHVPDAMDSCVTRADSLTSLSLSVCSIEK